MFFFCFSNLFAQESTEYVEDEILIKVEEPFKVKNKKYGIIKTDKDWFNKHSEKYKCFELEPIFKNSEGEMQKFYKIKFSKKDKIDKFIEKMNEEREVIKAWKNKKGTFCSNDAYFSQQWALSKIQATQAWNIHSGSSNVILAILDTGIDLGDPNQGAFDPHPDLVGNLWNVNGNYGVNLWTSAPRPYDEYSHGTHVAGIAGAITNNTLGVAGIAGGGYNGNSGITILPIKIGKEKYDLFEDKLSAGIEEAVNLGADIISISGALLHRIDCSDGDEEYGALLENPFPDLEIAVEYAENQGVLIVAAIGNNNYHLNECANGDYITNTYPAAYSSVISVANTNIYDMKAESNWAAWCDISAPGDNILSTLPRYIDTTSPIGYGTKGGTSMATPLVAGVAALLKSYAPEADRLMITRILKETTDNIDAQNPTKIGKLGTGRLNAFNALSLIQNNPSAPTGLNLSYSNNHPVVSWNLNSEADLKGYNVHIKYEFRNGSNPRFWTYEHEDHFVTGNTYTDYNWFTSGGDVAYYYIQSVDIIDN